VVEDPVTRSHRRHVLWRSLTRTRYVVAALLVVVVVVFALDKSHQPAGCYFQRTGLGKGAYAATRVCPKHGQKTKTPVGVNREEFALFVGVLLLIPTAVFVIPRIARLRDDIEIRRERHHR
jgi:hypothetical protein